MMGKRVDHTVVSHDPDFTPRDALLAAAIGVVERAKTAEVTIAEIAGVAAVGPDVASALFESVDELLIEAALVVCADDLRLATIAGSAPTVSAYAHHFAKRRDFYRAMRAGSVAAALDARMARVMAPLISVQIRTLLGDRITDDMLQAMTAEVTKECFDVTTGWIVEGSADDGPEVLYLRLEAIVIRRLEDARRLLG